MHRIVLLVVLYFLMGLPSLAIDEQCSNFVGSLVDVNNESNREDHDKLKALLKNNPSLKDLSNYALHANNHWFLLSKNANDLTKQLIGKSKLKTGTCFMVKGYVHGSVIIVKQISDISVQQF